MLGACGGFIGTNLDTGEEDDSSGGASTTGASGTDPTQPATSASGSTTPIDTTNPTNPTDPSDPTNPTDPTTETTDVATGSDTGTETTVDTDTEGETSTTTAGETSSTSTSTGEQVCEQQDEEPNDLVEDGDFISLGTVECGPEPLIFDGTIADGDDVDWLSFLGEWTCGNSSNPRIVVDVVDDDVEVCVSPACAQQATAFYFCVEGVNWTNNVGAGLGCCSTTAVRMDVDCNNVSDESTYASIRVRNPEAVCEDYALSYAFEVQ